MKKTQDNSQFDFRGFWKRFWEMLKPSHRDIVRLFALIVVVEVARLVGPYLLKLVIDLVTRFQSEDLRRIIGLTALMFVVGQVVSVLNYWVDRRVFRILMNVFGYLSTGAHRKMVFLDLDYHERENTGNKITKIQRGIDKINDLLGNLFWDVVPTLVQLTLTTAILFATDWRFGMIILIFVPIFFALTFRANREAFPHRKRFYRDQEKASGMMAQSIININTVKSFVQEARENEEYDKVSQQIRSHFLAGFRSILRYNLGRNFIIDSGRVLMLFFGVYLASSGSISLGTLVFVFTISEKALISLYRIVRLYDRIMEGGEAVDRLYRLYQEEPGVENPTDGYKPQNIRGDIKFRGVSFVYKGSKTKALDGVDLAIPSGCVTALVGPSGGGKTTLARMVYRHYDSDKGEILLDDKNIKSYDLYAFRKFIAIVPQEVEIFNSSVLENIAYANPEASFEEIQAAARIANAEEFIDDLKDGYETLVGERGIKLSGGQRQRVGIARAILANPRILIFDEATSNLDSYSERLIQEAMDKISRNRTVIIIAHRLSTIRKADKIVVLEKGKVVEEGSHAELARANGGLYQKLLKLQEMGEVD